jgi:hypothetical protein
MPLEMQLMRRLGASVTAAGLLAVLAGCGRVDTAAPQAPVAQAQTQPTAAAEATMAPLPTVVVEGTPAQPIPTVSLAPVVDEPDPASPDLGPAPAAGQVQLSADFAASGDLSAWTFADLKQDPAGPPAWSVKDGKLVVPYNVSSGEQFNDLLAVTGPANSPSYSFQATALARSSSILGIVVAYADPANFVAVTLADAASPNGKGLELVQYVNGQRTVLQGSSALLEARRWYTFDVQVKGSQIAVSVDGAPVLSGTASGALGQKVGLYGGSEGGAVFSNARLILN